MADKNFIVKNGLEVGGQEVVSSSGVVTSAALGGQTLASTDSPTFNNLTLTNDIAVGGDLNLTGDLNITGDVNSLSVTDLDVTDQTITLGAGQVESASGGSGIVVDGSSASILWDETNDEWDFNKSINVTGTATSTGLLLNVNTSLFNQDAAISYYSASNGVYVNGAGTNGWLRLNASGAENSRNSIDLYGQNGGDYVKIKAGNTDTIYVGANGAGRVGIGHGAANANLHIGSSAATGDATNPALQIGGASTYRLGMYTGAEDAIIENKNGDDGIAFRVKTAGEAMRIDGGTGNVGIGTSSPSGSLYVNGQTNIFNGASGNVGGISIAPNNTDTIIFSNSPGAYGDYGMRFKTMKTTGGAAYIDALYLKYDGNVGIGTTSPKTRLNVQSSVGASSYTGAGPGDIIRASGSGQGNWIASEDDGAMAYFGIDAGRAKFAGYNYATTANMDVIIGQSTFIVKPQHFEVSGNTALTGSFNSTHSNGPYIRFQESGTDKFYIGASNAVSGGTYTGYDLYAPSGKTIQIFSEGRSGSLASLQVKSDHIVLTQDINTSSTAGSNVVVGTSEEGAVHIITETGNARATGITFKAGSYGTQSAITSVHNTSEGTNVSIHTTDSYASGPKERFRFDHHGHARGVSYRGTKTAQPAFALGGGDVVRQNLKLYYNFADSRCYGTSGSTVTDLSGNNNTGNLGANVSYSSTVGGIMDFAGGNTNNGAFIGTPLTLPTTDSITLMFWIYYDDQPASPGDYQLMGWQANGGYAYVGVAANGGSYGYIGRSTDISETNHIIAGQKWHHLCVTRDAGDGSNGRSYTYIDGILTAFRKSEDPYAHSQTMTVGALGGASNGSGSAGHTLDGKIASVAVYDRALTQPEIWHNMMVDIHRLVGT